MTSLDQSPLWRVIGRTVRGAFHRRQQIANQDAIAWLPAGGSAPVAVVAVADGHGSADSYRSATGSEYAVQTVTGIFQEFLEQNPQSDLDSIERGVREWMPKELVVRWRGAVRAHLAEHPILEDRRLNNSPFIAYGSTILAALVTNAFALYLQLGDGDMLLVSPDGEVRRLWPRDQRFLGVETASLCGEEAWREVRLLTEPLQHDSPQLVLLCTDGYANSFRDDQEFLKAGRDILEIIRQDGIETVESNLESWLLETSEMGSGDDISLGIICRTADEEGRDVC